MDNIQEQILQHIAKTNQCNTFPKALKPYMKTICGACPLKDKCSRMQDKQQLKDIAQQTLEEMSRIKMKQVLGIESDKTKDAKLALLAHLAKSGRCIIGEDEKDKDLLSLKEYLGEMHCEHCLINKECSTMLNTDATMKERQKLATDLYNRIKLREQLELLDPND